MGVPQGAGGTPRKIFFIGINNFLENLSQQTDRSILVF
jgi:hypothetical protein